ncbi:MAG TPA: ATP-dependent Clp protease ATP-binding subunit ClpA [Gammaproteobacteria bacterium]|nr:ATP-dependent Clp protease ATP-binding subunit ClpA [Gammaproteobacteria bacterium]
MFSKSLEMTLNFAFAKAKEKRHEFMTVEHLLLALLENQEAAEVLIACGANLQRIRTGLDIFIEETTPHVPAHKVLNVQPTLGFQRVLQRAVFQAQSTGKVEVTGANVLAAIFGEQESQAAYFLNQENINRSDINNFIAQGSGKMHSFNEPDMEIEHQQPPAEMDLENLPVENILERYAINLNEQARIGKIDPLIGRKEEISRAIQVLCRRHKNNPLFVGEAGVGKTAIAEGLATMIVEGQVPEPMLNNVIYNLDIGYLLAGTKYRGDFEKRFKAVLKALKQMPQAVVFIDEIHTLIGAGAASGGAIDASNLIKPLLANGEIRCMGSTTYQEYRNIFEKDRALTRRFQKIDVPEPTVPETYQILKGLKQKFEEYHDVIYTLRALKSAAALSDRYITDRRLPDKAIDVVDEAGAYQRLQPLAKRKKVIGCREIEEIVASMARIPSNNVSNSDKEVLRNLERNLKMQVFGQDQAIESLAGAIKLARSGLREPIKPIGSFLLSGPTGVGKTEVTRQLAKILGIDLISFDMSEYMERHTVSRLIGAPPGYVGYDQGGLLTEAVIKHPHAVVLLDEIEKAHPDIFNLLLQVMDHGSLTDNNGRVADFRHVILIMTTNAGAEDIEKMTMGFTEHGIRTDDMEAIKRLFSPEFRNRLDTIVSFQHLSVETLHRVVDKFILELELQLQDKNVTLTIDTDSRNWLSEHGYDHKMGARPMARVIQEYIKKPLAEELLFGKLNGGGSVKVQVKDGKLELNILGMEKVAA